MHARRCCITTACATRMSDAAAVPTAAAVFIRSSVPLHAKDDKSREERRERREMERRGSGEGERRWDADDARLSRRRDVLQPCVGGATPACVTALESGDFTKIKLQM